MSKTNKSDEAERVAVHQFRTTHWSEVVSASRSDSAAAQALDRLCRTYWYPLYAFVRRLGYDEEQAKDLTRMALR